MGGAPETLPCLASVHLACRFLHTVLGHAKSASRLRFVIADNSPAWLRVPLRGDLDGDSPERVDVVIMNKMESE